MQGFTSQNGTHQTLLKEAKQSTIVADMASGRIQQRIDPILQKQAEAILRAQGLRPSSVHQSEIPNKRLQKTIREAWSGKGAQEYKTKEELFDALNKL